MPVNLLPSHAVERMSPTKQNCKSESVETLFIILIRQFIVFDHLKLHIISLKQLQLRQIHHFATTQFQHYEREKLHEHSSKQFRTKDKGRGNNIKLPYLRSKVASATIYTASKPPTEHTPLADTFPNAPPLPEPTPHRHDNPQRIEIPTDCTFHPTHP